jgi:PAS domain S-box-containing protein
MKSSRERLRETNFARVRSDLASPFLSSIVESSEDAIVSKSLDGIIASWNRAAERMFGYSASEAVGKHISLIIPPERRAEEDDVLGQIRRGQKVEHFETVRLTKDGRRIDISLTVSPIRNHLGELAGASKIARDITEKKRLEREREDLLLRERTARQQLTEALNARDEFIAVAAHELRTPLNAAVLALHVARRVVDQSARGPQAGRLVEKARAQLERFATLIACLLDVTRVRAGTFELYREQFDLSSLISDAASRFSTVHSGISLQLEPHIQGTWDRTRIDQTITNLLSNAIKYGKHNPILVSASADSLQATVRVRDEGEGIAPENLERLFGRFERFAPRSATEGLGLGLWITKQIVEKHGGTITVESALDKGSTFTMTLPLTTP